MKQLSTLLIALIYFSSLFGAENYSSGDELYVWAVSGLNMRTQANPKAEKILNIPYTAKVQVTDNNPFAHPFQYTMARSKTYNGLVTWGVEGHWVEVKYQGSIGYVFDAYLSKYPTINPKTDEHPYFNLDLFKEYGNEHWGGFDQETKTTTKDFGRNAVDPDKGMSSSYKLSFKNGAYYEDVEESFSGYVSIFIKDITMEEAYLIFNTLTGFEHKQKLNGDSENIGVGIKLIKSKKDELNFSGEGMSSINIRKVEGGVIIQSGGGC